MSQQINTAMLKPSKRTLGLLLVFILFQLSVLVGMYLKAQQPLWYGKAIRVAVNPIDPRSLFRGNYAILNYSISEAALSQALKREGDYENNLRIHEGAVIYTRLKQNKQGLYEPIDVVLDKPDTGVFIRGRLEYISDYTVRIKYGVEAYFASKERALEIEQSTSWRANASDENPPAIVTLMLSPSGRAAIKSLKVNE